MATNNNCPFDITPYTQSQVIKTPNISSLNYTNQDFWSMKTRLIEFIRQKFDKEFSDFVESSLAIMLIENWAFLADTLSFKMDQIANEIFIDTVTENENAFRLAKLIGFQPQPPIAARSLWIASLNNPVLTDVIIQTPFEVVVNAGEQAISIELFAADADNNPIFDQDIIIPANNIANASIVGLEGKTRTLGVSGNGSIGQTYALAQAPVIFDSIRVYVDGVQWEQVDYFTDSQPRREYRIEYDSNYTAYVIFGNNRAGLIPSVGSDILIVYRQGGGSVGNIVSNAVEKQTIVNVPGLSFSVPVGLRNYTKGEFGYDGDTIEDIRLKLPAWNRAQNRAVTGLDYKTLSDQFATPYQGQIGKATAVLRNHGCSGNIIDLYILALNGNNGLNNATNELKNALADYMEELKMFTDHVCIRDGAIVLTDINIDVVLDRLYRKFEDELRIKIQRRVDSFFNLVNWEYGQSLRDSDIVKILSDLKEINRFEVSLVTTDPDNGGSAVTSKFFEIIRPDTVNITFTYE
jgi:hypothetical protein